MSRRHAVRASPSLSCSWVSFRANTRYLGKLLDQAQPFFILLAGYFNPFLAYGLEKLMDDVVAAGGDGFIVVDLPPEEGR